MLIHLTQFYFVALSLLGLTSGVIFTLVSFTIPYQLAQAKYSTDVIGAIFLTALPYCFKPICAPFIDRYSIPVLCKKFGQRRGWALAAQTCLLLSTSGFLIINPTSNLVITSILILIIAFCAAIQDIIIDAYRIERATTKKELSIASTYNGAGFRIGMLISSTGALYLSSIFSWYLVYLCSFLIIMISPIVILCIEEPIISKTRHTITHIMSPKQHFQTIQDSFLSLKLKQPNWVLIMLFVFLYKASDSIPMAMSSPLFIDLSFTAAEIASISKGYGLIIMIFGGFVGGILTSKVGIVRSILICGSIQLLSPLMFMLLSVAGHNIIIFTITITIQNFCCGLGNIALSIYLSNLCTGEFVATQFAIISSFNSIVRITLSFLSGICATYIEWPQLFLYNTLFSTLFVLVFLKIYKKQLKKEANTMLV